MKNHSKFSQQTNKILTILPPCKKTEKDLQLANTLFLKKKYKKSKILYKKISKSIKSSLEYIYLQIGNCYYFEKKYKKAIKFYNKIFDLKINENSRQKIFGKIFNNIGLSFFCLEQKRNAVEYFFLAEEYINKEKIFFWKDDYDIPIDLSFEEDNRIIRKNNFFVKNKKFENKNILNLEKNDINKDDINNDSFILKKIEKKNFLKNSQKKILQKNLKNNLSLKKIKNSITKNFSIIKKMFGYKNHNKIKNPFIQDINSDSILLNQTQTRISSTELSLNFSYIDFPILKINENISNRYFYEGIEYYQKKLFYDCIFVIKKICYKSIFFRDGISLLIFCFYNIGDFNKMFFFLDFVRKFFFFDENEFCVLANYYYDFENYKKSIFFFKKIFLKNKNLNFESKNNLGICYIKNGNLEKGEKLLKNNLFKNREDIDTYINLALLLNKQGKFQETIFLLKNLKISNLEKNFLLSYTYLIINDFKNFGIGIKNIFIKNNFLDFSKIKLIANLFYIAKDYKATRKDGT